MDAESKVSYVASPDSEAIARSGGKARALAELTAHGFAVPTWFVVLPEACVQEGVASIAIAAEPAIAAAIAELPANSLFAVRSSAADEDGAQFSFAGQLDSFLFVRRENIPTRIVQVWNSGQSERVQAYRRENGLPEIARPPAVIVQHMIDAESAGVAFSSDPVTGERTTVVVSAVRGLGSGLVSGECEADTWRVNSEGQILERTIREKLIAHRAAPDSPEGVEAVDVDAALTSQPALTDALVVDVAQLARRAAEHFGRPQDIEWAVAGDKLWILQSRPITSLSAIADRAGAYALWDNSNIAESYNGITTALTFSFARSVYEEVYRQFCRILGVSSVRIAQNAATFRTMLGYLRGRVYYNLLSWYRVLALLPGYQINRSFMEQMMGVKESLPPEVTSILASRNKERSKVFDGFALVRSVAGLVAQAALLPLSIKNFHRRLDAALAKTPASLKNARIDELASEYRALEDQLLQKWDAPLVNDFFAMIFYGVLGKLCVKWCGDTDGTLHNALVAAGGGIISAEPARRLVEMARVVRDIPGLAKTLENSPTKVAEGAIAQHPQLHAMISDYLRVFGERCLEELKLETQTLADDPTSLYRSIGSLAQHPAALAERPVSDLREKSESTANDALAKAPLKRAVFHWVLGNARERVRQRENLRFERTRVFGRVRRIFVEIGRRLKAEAVLDDERDVFNLTVEEILGFIEGTAVTWNLRNLQAVRKMELARWRSAVPPGGRFETRGAPAIGNQLLESVQVQATAENSETLKGIGCCPGIVEGIARVILDPKNAIIQPGEILVAPRTDPGWIMLFPAAAGLLVEHGSLLSHSAIVARELGIPAIVSIHGLTQRLESGMKIRMDGATGTVCIISI
jgi:pyruvate,water dikinase